MDEKELTYWLQHSTTIKDMDVFSLVLKDAIKINIVKYKHRKYINIECYNDPNEADNSILIDWDWQTIYINSLNRKRFLEELVPKLEERFPSCILRIVEKSNIFCCFKPKLYILVQYKFDEDDKGSVV